MATVGIEFGPADTRSGAPINVAAARASETITSSATSQQTTAATAGPEYVTITATGGPVWAAFGTNPTAAAGTTALIADGATRPFYVAEAHHKIAIIDA